MSNVLVVVSNFEEAVSELRSQKECFTPEFSIYGEDCINIDVSCMIENLENFREGTLPECTDNIDVIIENLKQIKTIISNKNSVLAQRNSILQEQINDMNSAFIKQISGEPEMKFNGVIRISRHKIDQKYYPVIENVISEIGFTNVETQDTSTKIYLNTNDYPNVRDTVINAFHKQCFDLNLENFQKFKDFVQIEKIDTSYTDVAIKAIKSRV